MCSNVSVLHQKAIFPLFDKCHFFSIGKEVFMCSLSSQKIKTNVIPHDWSILNNKTPEVDPVSKECAKGIHK